PGAGPHPGPRPRLRDGRPGHQPGLHPRGAGRVRVRETTGVEGPLTTPRRVAIVGAALSDIGRVDDRTAYELHQHATSRPVDAPYGHTLISKYAMVARRHMHEFGTTIEQLAEIAVSARHNASLNPEAYYQDPITIDDVQGERVIADPFTKLHCCIRSDGGGAV